MGLLRGGYSAGYVSGSLHNSDRQLVPSCILLCMYVTVSCIKEALCKYYDCCCCCCCCWLRVRRVRCSWCRSPSIRPPEKRRWAFSALAQRASPLTNLGLPFPQIGSFFFFFVGLHPELGFYYCFYPWYLVAVFLM